MSDPLTKEDVREAVRQGVEDALLDLGIDHKDPLQMQQDFAYLRRLRRGSDMFKNKVIFGTLAAIGTLIVTLIVMGFQSIFPPPP